MQQVRPHRIRFSVIRLAWLAAALGMLACPMQYRGGAELPHDHAIFQLIYDAAHGSIDHHHAGDPASGDDAADVVTPPHAPVTTPAGGRVSPMGESADALVATFAAFAIWLLGRRDRWPVPPADPLREGERPAPEPPPPRLGFAAV
jgi:hypothetical protein